MDTSKLSAILRSRQGDSQRTPTHVVANWPSFPWDECDEADWKLQQHLLREEFPLPEGTSWDEWLIEHLKRLVSLEKIHAERIHRSKSRDDARGKDTIPGYASFHVSADKDPVIFAAQAEVQRLEETVQSVVKDTVATSRL